MLEWENMVRVVFDIVLEYNICIFGFAYYVFDKMLKCEIWRISIANCESDFGWLFSKKKVFFLLVGDCECIIRIVLGTNSFAFLTFLFLFFGKSVYCDNMKWVWNLNYE